MKVQTSELSGPALDRMVAAALCYSPNTLDLLYDIKYYSQFKPSSDWLHGGHLLEEEKIAVWPDEEGGYFASAQEGAGMDFHGDTLLEAAMRCLVDAKLGKEVELPE